MAVRISRSVRRSSPSRCRVAVTLASGMIADARMTMIADTTSSSTNVYPASALVIGPSLVVPVLSTLCRACLRLYGERDGPQLEAHRGSARTGRRAAERERDGAGGHGVEQDCAQQSG